MTTETHRRAIGAETQAAALIERNPKVRELMKRWNPDILQKTGQILLPLYVSDEQDADVNWLPVYWSLQGTL